MNKRAVQFEKVVEKNLVDRNGLLRSALDINTMKPFPSGYFTADMDTIRAKGADIGDYAGLMEYENSGMVSGAYLCAMLLKYRVTKDPAALDKAYRTFFGLRKLFDRCQKVEAGYFCKPYGNKVTLETSSDQYIYALTALDHFTKFARKTERDSAVDMIDKMVRFWVNRSYTREYFGTPLRWPLNRFTGFLYLHYTHIGDREILDEFRRLARLKEVRRTIPFADLTMDDQWAEYRDRARKLLPIEQERGAMLLVDRCETTQSGMLSIESCLEYNAPFRETWLWQMEKLYEGGALCIGRDGLSPWYSLYDHRSRRLRPVNPPAFIGTVPPDGYRLLAYAGNIRSGMHATMFARAAVYAHEYFPDPAKIRLVRHVLTSIGHEQMRAFIDPDNHLLPDMQWHKNIYSGDAVVHWLWAYWQGKSIGIW